MSNMNRLAVYFAGFVLGTLLVSFIMLRREAREAQAEDPWATREETAAAGGYEPLPEHLPEQLRGGEVLRFGYLPGEEEATERVWLLNFRESYPYVRVVEDIATGELSYMAADQVLIELKEGVDVTALKPMLDELGLRLRMFNRKERLAVIGVLSTEVDAVPATLAAVEPWSGLFEDAGPDVIVLR